MVMPSDRVLDPGAFGAATDRLKNNFLNNYSCTKTWLSYWQNMKNGIDNTDRHLMNMHSLLVEHFFF